MQRVKDEELFKLEFLVPGHPEKRTVLLSPEMNVLMSGPWESSEMADRCMRLRADLENVLAGGRLVVCWTPGKGRDNHQVGRLDPIDDNIFDIRSVDPSPGLRAIFHFAEKDVLVVHLCSPRSVPIPWLHRIPLLDRSSKAWRNALAESKRNWSTLFPKFEPHAGNDVHDYISNAFLV